MAQFCLIELKLFGKYLLFIIQGVVPGYLIRLHFHKYQTKLLQQFSKFMREYLVSLITFIGQTTDLARAEGNLQMKKTEIVWFLPPPLTKVW